MTPLKYKCIYLLLAAISINSVVVLESPMQAVITYAELFLSSFDAIRVGADAVAITYAPQTITYAEQY